MKVVCTADLHGKLPVIPECDFLVISGDICPHAGVVTEERFGRIVNKRVNVGSPEDIFFQSKWLMGEFAEWLETVPARNVIAVWGNHDWIGQRRPDMVPKSLRWKMLLDSGCEIEGIKFWGSPWQPNFYDWAFNAPSGPEGEIFLATKWAAIPDDTDVIIVHGPPRGFGDVAPDGRPTGSNALTERIFAVKPQLTVHGHIHCGYGQWAVIPRGNAPDGTIVNASVLNEAYELVNAPFEVEIYANKKEEDGDRTDPPADQEPAQEA